jgi:two-component SAPR family response regulator
VDVWAFDRLCARVENNGDPAAENADTLARAIALYAGEFLPGDPDAPWALKQRERLRARFTRLVETAGNQLEASGQWDRAIACYQRGLAADELAEPFYQGLMRCYQALGRYAEAVSTYRRLRQLLSVVLGIAPSDTTRSLARASQHGASARRDASR